MAISSFIVNCVLQGSAFSTTFFLFFINVLLSYTSFKHKPFYAKASTLHYLTHLPLELHLHIEFSFLIQSFGFPVESPQFFNSSHLPKFLGLSTALQFHLWAEDNINMFYCNINKKLYMKHVTIDAVFFPLYPK